MVQGGSYHLFQKKGYGLNIKYCQVIGDLAFLLRCLKMLVNDDLEELWFWDFFIERDFDDFGMFEVVVQA